MDSLLERRFDSTTMMMLSINQIFFLLYCFLITFRPLLMREEVTSTTVATAETSTEEEQQQLQSQFGYDATIPNGPTPSEFPDYRSIHSIGVSDDMWRYYRDMSLESLRQMDPYDPLHKAIPPPYCNAYCLDAPLPKTQGQRSNNNGGNRIASRSSFFGYPCITFQVTSRDDGYTYCLRRFDNVRSVSAKIGLSVTNQWTNCIPAQEHPGIVPFYQCFLSQRAVFFVHHYIPRSQSLKDLLASLNGTGLPESTIWSCIVQIVSAIRTIHRNLLSVRTLRLQYILATTDVSSSRLRIRLGSVGIVDALEFEARKHVTDLQCDDIRDLGRLILSISSGTDITSLTDSTTFTQCENFVAQNYSRELHNLAITLIRSRPRPPTINEVSQAVAQYCFDEQDAAYRSHDRIERGLCAEYESGRALRLFLKLGYINERPEMGLNRRWSQSGDCYVLSLFRDYGKVACISGGYKMYRRPYFFLSCLLLLK
jgi:PAB-dependent poly(A)-specific ribonuclease subunit 3